MNLSIVKSNTFRILVLTIVLANVAFSSFAFAQSEEYLTAVVAYQSNDFDKADKIWRQLADLGDYNAQYALGVMALRGESDRSSPEEAFHWFSLAAVKGHIAAMFNVGVAYWDGSGVEQDRNEGLRWWKKSAKAGDVAAQYNLGLAYYLDQDNPENLKKAARWIGVAAKQNHSEAINLNNIIKKAHPEIVDAIEKDTVVQLKSSSDATTQPKTTSAIEVAIATQPESDITDESNLSTGTAKSEIEQVSQPETDPTKNKIAKSTTTEKSIQTSDEISQSNESTISSDGQIIQPEVDNAQSQPQKIDYWKTIVNGALRITAAPSGTIFASLPEGVPIEVLDPKNYWTLITLPEGLKTWIYADYLDVTGDIGVIQGAGVRVRPKPSTDNNISPAIGAYRNGDRVIVLEKQDNWYGIRAPKYIGGWISNKHIARYQDTAENRSKLWAEMAAKGL